MESLKVFCIIIIGFLFAGFAFYMVIGYPFDILTCHARWSGSGHDVNFTVLGGCRVAVNGRYIPEDTFKKVDIGS